MADAAGTGPVSPGTVSGAGFGEGAEARLHLAALEAVVMSRVPELACGLVSRAGGPLVLNVVTTSKPVRSVDVECEYCDGGWWLRLVGGCVLARVQDVERAALKLAALLAPERGA